MFFRQGTESARLQQTVMIFQCSLQSLGFAPTSHAAPPPEIHYFFFSIFKEALAA